MTTFLLVHGAFRGGWAWGEVAQYLEAAGHDAHAPSLVGAGERVDELARVTSLAVWVDDLASYVLAHDLTDLVLVGHSQGGIVTTTLAARLPERIRCLVHLDAAVPDAGERAVDLGPGLPQLPPRDATVPPRPPVADEWLSEELAAWMAPQLTATPVGPSLDPLPGVPDGLDEHYYFCVGTPAGYPSTVTRERCDARGIPYRVLPTGHDAPLLAPELVVAELLRVAGDAR
ncbi:alpha/beta fold hydrolase [Nocardioides jishulii]|uniref:Alpha/beta hydrolase n=1 Tax=Nocardioides jishulii TaxID=2575440 RepID=A0A4U2YMC8_9ACTN|nr:alpha/beta fold hydrolase [Nocardioides jishulii]QCX27602.1 alpha/beta hydrolase [Nocardioides jishulii]TKI62409.1 alpha/beta hydrolase [Nocardioides jishulii]